MTDIAERMRHVASYCRDEDVGVVMDAISEIKRLEAEVKRYREILTSLRVQWID